jgi:hypothetical protein
MAFSRWGKAEFLDIERTYAAALRRSLAALDMTKNGACLLVAGDYLTSQLYDHFVPGWRDEKPVPRLTPEAEKAIVDRMAAFKVSTDVLPSNIQLADDDIKSLSVQHLVRRRKGDWYQLPKDMPEKRFRESA